MRRKERRTHKTRCWFGYQGTLRDRKKREEFKRQIEKKARRKEKKKTKRRGEEGLTELRGPLSRDTDDGASLHAARASSRSRNGESTSLPGSRDVGDACFALKSEPRGAFCRGEGNKDARSAQCSEEKERTRRDPGVEDGLTEGAVSA